VRTLPTATCPTCHGTVRLTERNAIRRHRHRDESGTCPASGTNWATAHTGIPA
jgi:hypothetical protein